MRAGFASHFSRETDSPWKADNVEVEDTRRVMPTRVRMKMSLRSVSRSIP